MAGKSVRPLRNAPQTIEGFDFTGHMKSLCADIVLRTEALQHVDMQRVAVSFNQTRKRVRHGMWASLTPMRFAGGSQETLRHGRRYRAQRLLNGAGVEMLYILSFYLPRFMQLSFHEKITTVFHELWHIGPDFDGDVRRHPGRCYAHSHSQQEYDAQIEQLVPQWLALHPPAERYAFLKRKFADLEREHGCVFGSRVRHPKLIPVE